MHTTMNDNHFENTIKQQSKKLHIAPPANTWDRVALRLDQKTKSKHTFYRIAAVWILLLATAATVFIYSGLHTHHLEFEEPLATMTNTSNLSPQQLNNIYQKM